MCFRFKGLQAIFVTEPPETAKVPPIGFFETRACQFVTRMRIAYDFRLVPPAKILKT